MLDFNFIIPRNYRKELDNAKAYTYVIAKIVETYFPRAVMRMAKEILEILNAKVVTAPENPNVNNFQWIVQITSEGGRIYPFPSTKLSDLDDKLFQLKEILKKWDKWIRNITRLNHDLQRLEMIITELEERGKIRKALKKIDETFKTIHDAIIDFKIDVIPAVIDYNTLNRIFERAKETWKNEQSVEELVEIAKERRKEAQKELSKNVFENLRQKIDELEDMIHS